MAFYVWPLRLSLWGRLKTPVVGSLSTLHELLIHCDSGSFLAPPVFTLGPTQCSSLWNFFIVTPSNIRKEENYEQFHEVFVYGPSGFRFGTGSIFQSMESFHKHNPQNHERKIENSGFRPRRFYTLGPTQYSSLWNFFIDKSSVCDRSWKSFSYFLYDLQGRSKSKEKFRSSNKRCCFFGLLYVLRFRSFHPEPAYWIRSGILMKLPQSSHRSLFFFQAYTAFWKPLIKAREVWSSYAIPRSSYQTVHPFSGSAAFARNRLTESEVEPSFYYLCLNGKLSISKRKLFKLFESPLADSRERS